MKQFLLEHVITEVEADLWPSLWRAAFVEIGSLIRFTPALGCVSIGVVVHSQVRGFLVWPLAEEKRFGTTSLSWSTQAWAASECRSWRICTDFKQMTVLVGDVQFEASRGVHYTITSETDVISSSAEKAFHGVTVPVLRELAAELHCDKPWPRNRDDLVIMLLKKCGYSGAQIERIVTKAADSASKSTFSFSAGDLPPGVLAHLSDEELQHLNAKPLEVKLPAVPSSVTSPPPAGSASSSSSKDRGPQILPEQQQWQELRCEACGAVMARIKTNPTHPAGPREEARMLLADGSFPVQGKLASSRLHSTWLGQDRARTALFQWALRFHRDPKEHPLQKCPNAE